MNHSGPGRGNSSCILNGERSKDEWTKLIDRVEAAILMSLANKVLAEAVERQEQIDEHRRQMKLVDLRNFSRKDSVG
jgi:hypothetical protein